MEDSFLLLCFIHTPKVKAYAQGFNTILILCPSQKGTTRKYFLFLARNERSGASDTLEFDSGLAAYPTSGNQRTIGASSLRNLPHVRFFLFVSSFPFRCNYYLWFSNYSRSADCQTPIPWPCVSSCLPLLHRVHSTPFCLQFILTLSIESEVGLGINVLLCNCKRILLWQKIVLHIGKVFFWMLLLLRVRGSK